MDKKEKERMKNSFILVSFWTIYTVLTIKLYFVLAQKLFN